MKIIYSSASYKNSILRSFFAILIGIGLVIWPDTALEYIIILIGIIFLATGLLSFLTSYQNRDDSGQRGLMSFSGIGSMVFGVVLIAIPDSFVKVLMFILGFILVVAAIGQMVVMTKIKKYSGTTYTFSYIFSILILISGIVILFDPFKSAQSIFILFGITSILYGITSIVGQYKLNKLRKSGEMRGDNRSYDDHQKVEDVDYEEVK